MTTHNGPVRRALSSAIWTGLGAVGARRLIDALSIALLIAALVHWGDPDMVLDALWVTLAIGAFVFGFGMTVLRIALVTLVVLAVAAAETALSGHGTEFELLDAEWLLMLALSLLVALLADRVAKSASGYASLYRDASGRLVSVREHERESLARDLHDGVGQTLTAVILSLDTAAASLAGAPDAPSARRAIDRARTLSVGALDEARSIAARLAPARIREAGLGAALHDLAGSAGIAVEIWFAPELFPPRLIEPERELGIYRVVQEALSNAARHSRAAHVWVDAWIRDDEMAVEVRDDGVGFDERTSAPGMGLAGMKERAAQLQARLIIRSRPGAGTTIRLTTPLNAWRAPGPLWAGRLGGEGAP